MKRLMTGLAVAIALGASVRADDTVQAFFKHHCLECHSGEEPEGEMRLDQLKPEFADEAGRKPWRAVLKRLRSGQMPPKEKPRPPEPDIHAVADWISSKVRAAEAVERQTKGRVVLRRLNRIEYENTVRDLLGVAVELRDLLPPDSAFGGFDNVGEAHHVSSFLMDKYLEAADVALDIAIANGPKPPETKKRYSITETHNYKSKSENVFRKLDDDTVVLFTSSHWQAVILPMWPSDRGDYRFRISASAFQSDGKPVTYRVDAGLMLMTGKPHLVGYFDAPPGEPKIVEFVDKLEPRNSLRILPYGLPSSGVVHKIGADKYDGSGVAIQWVDVEGPLNPVWPPESHRRIFGDLPQDKAPTYNHPQRVEVVSKAPKADAERILRAFARRAFRREVTDDDVSPYLALVESKLAESRSFEQAVRVGLAAIMVSPDFLFLREAPGKLDDFALASRLSYFLWSTMPDDELFALAEQHKLGQPEVLREQVERLLKSPKAKAFTENFVGQWLGLRDIDFTDPSHQLYPEYDDMLRASMVRETELFFTEVLKNDLSLTNVIASDFSMLNGRLAKHYGIPDVYGWEFRKVPLPPDSHRGGVLTMASVLKVTANGTTTSPVTRGSWILDRLLGTPPPRPPENIAALEPDTRGATTIRSQLAKHRQIASCSSCHALIDPPGFALESFDVIGGWRDYYRSTGNGKEVKVDGRRMPYLQGQKIDPADVLPDGRSFRDIDEFKQLLLADKDQVARALTAKLLTYATGGAANSADQPEIDAIVDRIRAKHYGFRSLIHEVVASELFRTK